MVFIRASPPVSPCIMASESTDQKHAANTTDQKEEWWMEHFEMCTIKTAKGTFWAHEPPCMRCKYCLAHAQTSEGEVFPIPATATKAASHLISCLHSPFHPNSAANRDALAGTSQVPIQAVPASFNQPGSLVARHTGESLMRDQYNVVHQFQDYSERSLQQPHQYPHLGRGVEPALPQGWGGSFSISRQLGATRESEMHAGLGQPATIQDESQHASQRFDAYSSKRRRIMRDEGTKPDSVPFDQSGVEPSVNELWAYVQRLEAQVQHLQRCQQQQQEMNQKFWRHLQNCNQQQQEINREMIAWMQESQSGRASSSGQDESQRSERQDARQGQYKHPDGGAQKRKST